MPTHAILPVKHLHDSKRLLAHLLSAEERAGLIDGFVYDQQDAGMTAEDGLALLCTDTLMTGPATRERLAREVIEFAEQLAGSG